MYTYTSALFMIAQLMNKVIRYNAYAGIMHMCRLCKPHADNYDCNFLSMTSTLVLKFT